MDPTTYDAETSGARYLGRSADRAEAAREVAVWLRYEHTTAWWGTPEAALRAVAAGVIRVRAELEQREAGR